MRWWHAFDLNSNGTIEDVNELLEGEPWPYPSTTGARALPRKAVLPSDGRKRRKSQGNGKGKTKKKNAHTRTNTNAKRRGRNHRQRAQ